MEQHFYDLSRGSYKIIKIGQKLLSFCDHISTQLNYLGAAVVSNNFIIAKTL